MAAHPATVGLDLDQFAHYASVVLSTIVTWAVVAMRGGFKLFRENLDQRDRTNTERWEKAGEAIKELAASISELTKVTGTHQTTISVTDAKVEQMRAELERHLRSCGHSGESRRRRG